MLEFYKIADFAGPMGLLCILITVFAEVRRLLSNPLAAELALGFIFGGIALMEMALPFTPFDGVIIDLRNIPVMLAGAFLGWRGLAMTLAMTTIARMYIGGTGATAGVLSILFAGYAGAFWARITRNSAPRGIWHFALLGPLSGLSFAGALLLPVDVSLWFLTTAAPPLWACYMLVLPLLAMLIHRELLRSDETLHLRACTLTCPQSGLLRPASFLRKTLQMAVSAAPGTVEGLLLATPVLPSRLRLFWGSSLGFQVQAALATALTGKLTHSDCFGLTETGQVIVPLTRQELRDLGPTADALAQVIARQTIAMNGGPTVRLNAELKVLRVSDPATLPEILAQLNVGGSGDSFVLPKKGVGKADPLFRKLEASLAIPRG